MGIRRLRNTRRKQVAKVATSSYKFVNQGRIVTVTVQYPLDIPAYRIKEVIDQEFVGKTDDVVQNSPYVTGFAKLNSTISWTAEAGAKIQ